MISLGNLGLHRIGPDGSIVATHALPGINRIPAVSWLAIVDFQSDGRIIFAHPADCSPCVSVVERYLPDLRKDPTFTTQSWPGNDIIFAMAVTRDDRILVAGNGKSVGSLLVRGLIRLTQNGEIDPTFQFSPDGNLSVMRFVKELSDRKLIVSGTFFSITTSSQTFSNTVRLFPDGTLDPTFRLPTFPRGFELVADLIEEPDGKLIIAFGKGVVRVNQDGSLDPTFNADPNWGVDALKLLPNGQILAFQSEYWPSGGGTATRGPAVVRLNNDGRLIFGQPRLTSGGQFEIMSLVQPPAQYVLEFSQDLQSWSRIATNTATGNQLLWRAGLPASGRGFFRAIRE